MIKIISGDVKEIYQRLLNAKPKDSDDSSDWRNGKLKVGTKESLEYRPYPIGDMHLIAPFERATGYLYSNGRVYRGRLSFFTKRCESNNVLNLIRKNINDKSVTDIEDALLFMREKDPYFVLFKEHESCIDLNFGGNGTLKRELSHKEHFEGDFKNLTEIATDILNAVYKGKETPDITYRLDLE